ncbi:MAG: hypothetical protein HGA45_27315 [Chloroflexales bacterium]|nr:hypothetical protein [Chloroflexales bacterium]
MMNSSQRNLSSLSERDSELLSAYLDKQLSVAETASLERRIEAEPTLQAELEGLRSTAAALRALEPLRPPRSFTLDPATAPKPRFYFSSAWVMQLGSGLAGLALVLLAAVQMLSTGALSASAPAPMAAKEATAAQAPYTATMIEPAPTAAPMLESVPQPAPTGPPAAPAARQAQPAPTAGMSESVAAPTQAATAAEDAGAAAVEPPEASAAAAGGAEGGPFTNSAGPGVGGGASTDGAIQSTDTSSPDTSNLPGAQAAPDSAVGFPPGLTLAIGVALIGLGIVWHLYSRRRG